NGGSEFIVALNVTVYSPACRKFGVQRNRCGPVGDGSESVAPSGKFSDVMVTKFNESEVTGRSKTSSWPSLMLFDDGGSNRDWAFTVIVTFLVSLKGGLPESVAMKVTS